MRAALIILQNYRKYKIRQYVTQLNRLFINVKQMKDFGKSLPWPTPKACILRANKGIVMLKQIYQKWRSFMILKRFPREEWPQMQLKIIAADAFKSRRHEWGVRNKWEGNYLDSKMENDDYAKFANTISNLKMKDSINCKQVLFSSFIRKFNKFNKSSDRALVVTDNCIYKIDIKNYKSLKKVPIERVTGISVSPGMDQLVIIHLNGGNDLVFSLITFKNQISSLNKVGELVAIVLHQHYL